VTRSLLLSGAGRYADEWHDFAATSQRLASILAGLGHDVEISDVLGYDVESYDSAEHCTLIARSVQWLSGHLPVSRPPEDEYRRMSR
jgi:hypothetical protein